MMYTIEHVGSISVTTRCNRAGAGGAGIVFDGAIDGGLKYTRTTKLIKPKPFPGGFGKN